MRKYYLDNLRWGTVLLVLVYHVFYFFNALGVLGGAGPFYPSQPWDVLCTILYPWFMALLFVIAGASAKYALDRQTTKAFLHSKTRKLLIPSTLGLFVYQFGVGYLNLRIAGAWDQIPFPINYLVAVLSSIGPLWFIQLLWIFSLVLVLLRKLPFCEKLWAAGANAPIWLLIGLFLPIWGAAQILNTSVVTVYRFGIYGLAYLLGYFIFSHDAVQDRLARWRWLLLGLAAASGVAYTAYFYGKNFAGDAALHHIITNFYLWMVVLAAFGCGKHWLDRTSPFASYLAKSSFGIYVVHYLIMMCLCLGLRALGLPVFWIYALSVLGVLLLSPLVFALLRRIPVIRYITFGIRKQGG